MRTSQRIFLNLGLQKRKAIRELKQGTGPIIQELQEAVKAVAGEQETGGKEIVPVAILYRRRARKRNRKKRGVLGEVLRRL